MPEAGAPHGYTTSLLTNIKLPGTNTLAYFEEANNFFYYFSLKIDSGEVMCIAANGVPPIISHKFRIVVQCESIITGYPTTSDQAREVLLKRKDQYG